MPTIAELAVLFTANDSGFQRVNTSVQKALGKTSEAAEDTSTWIGLLEKAIADLSDVEKITTRDTQSLTTSLKSLGRAAAELDKAMDPSKVRAYSSAIGTLDGVGSALAVEFSELQKTVASLNRAFASQSPEGYGQKALGSSASVDALALSATEAEARILALNQQLAATRALVPRNINVPVRNGGGGGGASNSALGSAGLSVGRSLAKNVTVPILAAGAASVYLETSFQASMAKIEALSGISHDQVEKWGNEILDLGPKMGKMPIELAQGMFYVANEIKDSAQAMDVLEKAAGMSAEGMGKTEANAKALVFVMHDYADANMTAAQAADTLVAATRVGNFDVSALTSNLGKLLPVASSLDIPFNQVAGAIAAMTKEGATIPQATTGIQRMLLGLEKPSEGAKKALKAIGTSAEEVVKNMQTDLFGALVKVAEAAHKHDVALADIFTTANGLKTVVSILGKDLDDSRKSFDDVAKSAGAYQRALAIVNKTDLMTLNKSLASLESAGIKLGDDLAPEIYALAKDIGDLADSFRHLDPETQASIVRVALLLAGIGPLIKVFGLLEKAMVLAKSANVGMNMALWLTAPAGKAAAGGLEVAADEAAVAQGKFALLTAEINGARLSLAALGIAAAAYAGWQIGTLAHNAMDEAAKKAGYENSGDYLVGNFGSDDSFGSLSDFGSGVDTGGKSGDQLKQEADQPAPGFYSRWLSPDATKKRAALQNVRDDRDARAAIDTAHKKYLDDQRRQKAQQDTAMIYGGSGSGSGRGSRGGQESQASREGEQRVQALQERMQSLAQTLRMNGNESDTAAARYEALFGEFATGAAKAVILKKAIAELTPKQKNDAAQSLFHEPFKSLSGGQQARAEMVALTALVESKKKSAEATKEQAAAQKALNDELAKGRADLMAGKATTDEDRVSWTQFGKPFAALTDPAHKKWTSDTAKLDKDKQAASVNPSAVEFNTGPNPQDAQDALDTDVRKANIGVLIAKATSDEDAISLERYGKAFKDLTSPDMIAGVRALATAQKNLQAAKYDPSAAKFSDGSELVGKMNSTYLESLHTLNKELSDVGVQTMAVRVATLEWDDASSQTGKRMTHDQAVQVAALQQTLANLKEVKAQQDQIAQQGGDFASGLFTHFAEHGAKGLWATGKGMLKSDATGMASDYVKKQASGWLSGLMGGKSQDKNVALMAKIDAQIAALNANTVALGGTPASTGGSSSLPGVAGLAGSLGKPGTILGDLAGFSSLIPGFAAGGDYGSGPFLVGENGPEIVNPGGRGNVIPNHMLGGDTHNDNRQINLEMHYHAATAETFSGPTTRQHARQMHKFLKENG